LYLRKAHGCLRSLPDCVTAVQSSKRCAEPYGVFAYRRDFS
jgi:hypothetical protein